MTTISASVGEAGANRRPTSASCRNSDPCGHDPKGIDGGYGNNTRDAILSSSALHQPSRRPDRGRWWDAAASRPGQPGSADSAPTLRQPRWPRRRAGDRGLERRQLDPSKEAGHLEPGFRADRSGDREIEGGRLPPKIVFGWRSTKVRHGSSARAVKISFASIAPSIRTDGPTPGRSTSSIPGGPGTSPTATNSSRRWAPPARPRAWSGAATGRASATGPTSRDARTASLPR